MPFEYILLSLGVSLALTLILELGLSLLFRIIGSDLLFITLANILTNPAVVVLYLLLCRHYSLSEIPVVCILELCAVIIEGVIYKTRCHSVKKPFLFSIGTNAFSYLCGVIIRTLI